MRTRHLFLIFLILCIVGCGKRARLIPKDKMVDLYVDMLISDQWLKDNNKFKSKADTCLYYDPIFKRHHCTFEDYDYSVYCYSADPEDFQKILEQAKNILADEAMQIEDLLKQIEDNKRINKENKYDYKNIDFDTDFHSFADSALLWPIPVDSSLVDSLVLDSLHVDSLHIDSLRVDSLAIDSLQLKVLSKDSLCFELADSTIAGFSKKPRHFIKNTRLDKDSKTKQ